MLISKTLKHSHAELQAVQALACLFPSPSRSEAPGTLSIFGTRLPNFLGRSFFPYKLIPNYGARSRRFHVHIYVRVSQAVTCAWPSSHAVKSDATTACASLVLRFMRAIGVELPSSWSDRSEIGEGVAMM